MRTRLILAITTIAALAAATLLGLVITSGSSTDAAQPSAALQARARAALVRYLAHSNRTAIHPSGVRPAVITNGTTHDSSVNWSGWADVSSTTGAFTKVSGSWSVPSVSCSAEDQLTSEWVGLDGWTNGTVEQDGTLDWCFEGTAFYYSWYEMYPAGSVNVGNTVRPGDKITASVTRSGSSYTLKLTDATHTANSFSKTTSCSTSTCKDTSAEWIAERPGLSTGITPLAKYGTWTLSGASETAGGKTSTISGFSTNYEITMIDSTETYNLSTVSSLTSGTKFSTTWKNSF